MGKSSLESSVKLSPGARRRSVAPRADVARVSPEVASKATASQRELLRSAPGTVSLLARRFTALALVDSAPEVRRESGPRPSGELVRRPLARPRVGEAPPRGGRTSRRRAHRPAAAGAPRAPPHPRVSGTRRRPPATLAAPSPPGAPWSPPPSGRPRPKARAPAMRSATRATLAPGGRGGGAPWTAERPANPPGGKPPRRRARHT